MPSNSDKWIRSVKDNPAGKVVADPDGNRWEWQGDDETARLLNKLENTELAIEKTDLLRAPQRKTEAAPGGKTTSARDTAAARNAEPKPRRPLRPGARDAGGEFDPYDHSGKPKSR